MMNTLDYEINLSAAAIEEVKRLIKEEEKSIDEVYLRIGAKGGGCSGLSYVLEFDTKESFDQEFNIDGVRVIVDKRHALYVAGMEVDFEHGLNDRGFIFKNPNAKSTCGCGTSFAT